jgi:hypothetical protein
MFTKYTTCYQCNAKIATKKSNTCILCTQYFCTMDKCRQEMRLTSRQKKIEVCTNCATKELNIATNATNKDLNPIQHLCIGLSSLQLSLSGRRVLETVTRGSLAYRRLYSNRGSFASIQEIVDFSWFLVAASANKNQQFTSGMFVFEDPQHNIFNALAEHGYSRVLKSLTKMGEKKSFGSSHFIDFIQFSRTLGPSYVPEECNIINNGENDIMERGLSGEKTGATAETAEKQIVNGYQQIGIDLRKRHLSGASKIVTRESCKNIGVYLLRRHLLCGKLPKKSLSDTRKFTFVKLETFGTARVSEALGHSISFMKTRGDVGRTSRSSSKALTTPSTRTTPSSSTIFEGHDNDGIIIENHSEIKKRKEHTPKLVIELFQKIIHLLHGIDTGGVSDCHGSSRDNSLRNEIFYDSPLVLSEMLTKRPKILGLSFMSSIILQVSNKLKKFKKKHSKNSNELINAIEQWNKMLSNHDDWDNMDIRFGQEVIFAKRELVKYAKSIRRENASERLFRVLSAGKIRQNSNTWSCSFFFGYSVVGLVVIQTLLAQFYGYVLLFRRWYYGNPWKLVIVYLIEYGTLAWTFVLIALILLVDGRW